MEVERKEEPLHLLFHHSSYYRVGLAPFSKFHTTKLMDQTEQDLFQTFFLVLPCTIHSFFDPKSSHLLHLADAHHSNCPRAPSPRRWRARPWCAQPEGAGRAGRRQCGRPVAIATSLKDLKLVKQKHGKNMGKTTPKHGKRSTED